MAMEGAAAFLDTPICLDARWLRVEPGRLNTRRAAQCWLAVGFRVAAKGGAEIVEAASGRDSGAIGMVMEMRAAQTGQGAEPKEL